ncbi:MAG: hypothetical protein J6C85_06370 [Alphaproteobacteria bacterium]|nr:hypothetical protein [Alphaproteobacteria bacterium]
MSKGPITARIDKVVKGKDCFSVCVTVLADERKSEIKIPDTADVSAFAEDKIITFHLAEDVSNNENFTVHKREDGQPVLIFLSDEQGFPFKNGLLWLEKGKETLTLEKLPQIAELLLEVSPYYSKRRVLVEKALEVLKLAQDPETIDALFSMKAENLYALLGDTLEPLPQTTAFPLTRSLRLAVIEDFFIPVQIADCLLSLATSGVDLENPRRRDLWHILFLALMHGESKETVNDFIARYERQ